MNKRILIAPNSFKECADSLTIAELIKENLNHLKNTDLIVKPISDGGDGFLNVCKYYFGGDKRFYSISAAYDESRFDSPVLYCQNRKEVYIESADVLGLKVVPKQYRNPLELSSKGLGELLFRINEDIMIEQIIADKVYLGIGGTATIDMGIGMMSKMGLKLYDIDDKEINVLPKNFSAAAKVAYESAQLSFKIIPVIDVANPLIGELNGIQTFGPQKGADENTISILINHFNHLLNLLENKKLDIFSQILSGAGGGIPAALQIFYDCKPYSSSDFISKNIELHKFKNNVRYLITGEGAFDYQTNFGKGAGILIESFTSFVDKIFMVCGKMSLETKSKLPENVIPIELLKFFPSEADSIKFFNLGIKKACEEIIGLIDF
jgi:glycerate kinase